jgi:hypothetical protein
MQTTDWTVITNPPATSERWAAWVNARRSFETPLVALVMAAIAFLTPAPDGLSGARMLLVGILLASAFFMWERRGFRELLGRHEAELARLRNRSVRPPKPLRPASGE